MFVVHVARLYAEQPDQKLEMPVVGISKSQIADSWHAPREGDRLHEGQDIFAPRGTQCFQRPKAILCASAKTLSVGRRFRCSARAEEFTTMLIWILTPRKSPSAIK